MDLTAIPAIPVKKQLRKKRYSVKLLNGTLAVVKHNVNQHYSIAGDRYLPAAGGQPGYQSPTECDAGCWSLQPDSPKDELRKETGHGIMTLDDNGKLECTNNSVRKSRKDSGFSELSESLFGDGLNERIGQDFAFLGASTYSLKKDERDEGSESSSSSDSSSGDESGATDEDDGLYGIHKAVAETTRGLHFDNSGRAECALESICDTLDALHENLRAMRKGGNVQDGRSLVELFAEVNTKLSWIMRNLKAIGILANVNSNDKIDLDAYKTSCPEKWKVVYEKLYETSQLITTPMEQWRNDVEDESPLFAQVRQTYGSQFEMFASRGEGGDDGRELRRAVKQFKRRSWELPRIGQML